MLFSSITFLYYFFPIVTLVYYIAPKKFRNTVLLASSLFFYGWGEPKLLIFMAISIIQGYMFGLLIEHFNTVKSFVVAKTCLATTILLSLGMLGYFKYVDFFIDNFNKLTGLSLSLLGVALPIGISFYTFQILSYSIDVYRGDTKAQKNIINFSAYISMFPQLIAGPIVRYSDIEKQLKTREYTSSMFANGLSRFIIGLSKKVLIANVLGELIECFKASESKSVLFVWVYAIAYSLHIYFDFSGYSDMAIGLGKILGFRFTENFDYPYISKSITEFWRRWHISLGRWFRDYLYIPLGGNRVSKKRWIFNISVVWLATGFWHGASWNFIIWGIMFAVFLLIEKLILLKYLRKSKVLGHIYVMLIVIISFVIFDNTNIVNALEIIKSMFGFGGLPLVTTESIYMTKSYFVILITAIIGATPLVAHSVKRLQAFKVANKVLCVAEPIFLVILLATVTSFLIDGSFNPFLYFRF